MKKSFYVILMVLVIILSSTITSGIAQSEDPTELPLSGDTTVQDQQGRYMYLDIPYDTITQEGA